MDKLWISNQMVLEEIGGYGKIIWEEKDWKSFLGMDWIK